MDGVDAGLQPNANNVFGVEISLHRRFAFADQIGLVALEAMQRKTVFLRVNRYRFDFQFGGSPHDANRYFAPISDQQFLNSLHVRRAQPKDRNWRLNGLYTIDLNPESAQSGRASLARQRLSLGRWRGSQNRGKRVEI